MSRATTKAKSDQLTYERRPAQCLALGQWEHREAVGQERGGRSLLLMKKAKQSPTSVEPSLTESFTRNVEISDHYIFFPLAHGASRLRMSPLSSVNGVGGWCTWGGHVGPMSSRRGPGPGI